MMKNGRTKYEVAHTQSQYVSLCLSCFENLPGFQLPTVQDSIINIQQLVLL